MLLKPCGRMTLWDETLVQSKAKAQTSGPIVECTLDAKWQIALC